MRVSLISKRNLSKIIRRFTRLCVMTYFMYHVLLLQETRKDCWTLTSHFFDNIFFPNCTSANRAKNFTKNIQDNFFFRTSIFFQFYQLNMLFLAWKKKLRSEYRLKRANHWTKNLDENDHIRGNSRAHFSYELSSSLVSAELIGRYTVEIYAREK